MTTLTFQNPDEARAWDMYMAAIICHPDLYEDSDAMSLADTLVIQRRKRMAPARVGSDSRAVNPDLYGSMLHD